MSHHLVLLSPYPFPGQYPLTLADDDMACWLNGYTLMWHPALLSGAAEPPRIESPYDHETPKAGTIYITPETPSMYLPENWQERLKQAGSMSIAAAADRGVTLANLKVALEASDAPALGWKEALAAPADMLNLFFGVGLGYVLQATLAEAMEHENLLEKETFWSEVQKSIHAMGSEDAEPEATSSESPQPAAAPTDDVPPLDNPFSPDLTSALPTTSPEGEKAAEGTPAPKEDAWLHHLRLAAQKLLSAREVLYPVAIHWLDLHLLSEASLAGPWPAAIELGLPTNFVASADLLDKLARHEPEKFALVKTLVQQDLLEICGGDYREREEALLPIDSQLWNLREGLEVSRRLLGKDIRVFARRTFGHYPRLPLWLATHGVTKLLFVAFDDTAGLPNFAHTTIAWTAPDGKQIDAFVRAPKPADKVETFFNLGHSWFKTTREDHHATVCLLHKGEAELPWHRDLIALSKLAPVLGNWTTFSRYFNDVSPSEYPPSPTADDFHHDLLNERVVAKTPDPVTGFHQHLRLRRRIDACWTYAALQHALGGATTTETLTDHLESLERVFETQPNLGVEPGGLVELEQQIAGSLADRLQSRSQPNQPGVMLLNPCGFARRFVVELDDATVPLPVEGIVKACQLDGTVNRIVVEVPALGFAWIPRSGPPGTPSMASRLRVGDAKTLTIRNEFFEVDVDGQTGGLKAIRDHKTRINRLGQRLVFNPGSRMVARSVQVTSSGPALGEIISEGVLLGDQDQELATFKQRFRAWIGRPLLEMRIELTPKQPPAGYPWHAYFGARFAYRDERTHLFRGQGGLSHVSTHPRPQSPEFLDLRLGPMGTAIFPNGLPFHQKQEGRMIDVILIPEGEMTTTFDLGIALDRDQPMLTAWGLASPLAMVPTTKGPPHVGSSGWLFHLDMPSLLLTKLLPGRREKKDIPTPETGDAITAQLLECSGHPAMAEFRCVRDPSRAVVLNGVGQFVMNCPFSGDAISLEVAPQDWIQLQVEFANP